MSKPGIKLSTGLVIILLIVAAAGVRTGAQQGENIALPAPDISGGKPLMKVLNDRKSDRSFSSKDLSLQTLSNLLWAACGINRKGEGKRTAPSAMNRQEIDLYVAMVKGLYLYDAEKHALTLVIKKDLRSITGKQEFVRNAPVNLVYVADYTRMSGNAEDKLIYSASDTGFISQNVYLFCASEGLATVVRGHVDRKVLAKEMKLKATQKVVLTQTVGHRK